MGEQQRIVVTEIRNRLTNPTSVHHLPMHRPESWWSAEADFVPVRCGGGIQCPSRHTVPRSQVCPDCLTGRLTMPAVSTEESA